MYMLNRGLVDLNQVVVLKVQVVVKAQVVAVVELLNQVVATKNLQPKQRKNHQLINRQVQVMQIKVVTIVNQKHQL